MLELKNISKAYPDGGGVHQVLLGITASIGAGELVGLCGPSGSGKSTLLNICGLLDPHYQGELWLAGQKMRHQGELATQLRRQLLGFVFQRFNLIPVMTALENVEYPLLLNGVGAAERKRRAKAMLERVGVGAFAAQRPDRLSGGQQQRVAIARALVHRPKLVIADEPTASLDGETAAEVITLMKDLCNDTEATILVATHDPRMSEQCDRLLNLQDGRLVKEPQACYG